jgi:hypothetical protein
MTRSKNLKSKTRPFILSISSERTPYEKQPEITATVTCSRINPQIQANIAQTKKKEIKLLSSRKSLRPKK